MADLITTPTPTYPSPPEWLREITDSARKQRRRDGTPENTRRATESAARIFGAWCEQRGLQWLPTSPEAVALFIEDYSTGEWTPPGSKSRGAALATVKARLSGINALHRAYGLAKPGDSEIVREALKAITAVKGSRQTQAAPLNADARDCILSALDQEAASADPQTAFGRRLHKTALRDAALIALAYDAFARRSELAALNVEDVTQDPDGSGAALIHRSKTDQKGKGALLYVAPATMRRLGAWRATDGIDAGALFPPIGPNAKGRRLEGGDVLRIMRRRAQQAGVPDAGRITGHSARIGAAQDAIADGCDLLSVQQAGRWKSAEMPARYGERLAIKRSAAARLAKTQGRM